MSRTDLAPHLIHFTKGEDLEEAFRRLQAIVATRRLLGSASCIRGGYACICFSEAPVSSLSDGLVNERYYSRYSPFGVMISKEWLFSVGGRPVIYQTEEEYSSLPEEIRWRHVRYDIREGHDRIDFTWEREWRLRADAMDFDHTTASLVVLDAAWANRLLAEHERAEDYRVLQYSTFLHEQIAEMYREDYKWRVLTLR